MIGNSRVYLLRVSSFDDSQRHIRASLRAVDEEQVLHFAGFEALSRHLRATAIALSLPDLAAGCAAPQGAQGADE